MEVDKKELTEHLKLIHAGGLIRDCVIGDGFTSVALAEDSGFMVAVEGREDFGSFGGQVGILDLSLVISALQKIQGPVVNVEYENNRLVLSAENTLFNLLTCDPQYVSTNKNQDHFETFLQYADANSVCSFSPSYGFVDRYTDAYSIIQSDATYVNVTPDGTQFVIGHHSENESVLEEDKPVHSEPFSVRLSSGVLNTALKTLAGETMIFTGEDAIVELSTKEREYRYIISPISE